MCRDHKPQINLNKTYGGQILCLSLRSDLRKGRRASETRSNLMNEGIVIAPIETLMAKPIRVSNSVRALQITQE